MGFFGGKRRGGHDSDDLFGAILGGIGVVAGIAAAAGAVAYGISKANEKDSVPSEQEDTPILSLSGIALLFIPEGEYYLTTIYCRLLPLAVGYVVRCGELDNQAEKLALIKTIKESTRENNAFPPEYLISDFASESFEVALGYDNAKFAQIPQYVSNLLDTNLENPSGFVMENLLPLIADSLRHTNSGVEEAMMTIGRPYGINHSQLREMLQNAGFNYDQQPAQPTGQQIELERIAQAYVTLGLNSDATSNQVKSSYRRLSQQFHPDVIQNKGLGKAVEEAFAARFAEITDSYNLLSKTFAH
jgi:hypothetical protein